MSSPIIYPSYYDTENDRACNDIFGPTFLGHQIIVQKDGDNLLFNKHKDTITIKTAAKLGESWLAFNKPGHPEILATVIEHDLANVLGVMDSVKSIHFTINDTLIEPLDSLVNDTIEISKNFGIVNTIGFREFPYCEKHEYRRNCAGNLKLIGYNNPKRGIQNLTWFDVYDFQVGDVFHTLYTSSSLGDFIETKTILTILNRKDNINSNGETESIEYTQKREIRCQSIEDSNGDNLLPCNNAYISDTITQIINPNPPFDILPGFPFEVEGYDGEMYAQNRMSVGGFNNPPGVISKTPPVLLDQYCYIDSCWNNLYCFVDGQQPNNTYYRGLGGPYYYGYSDFSSSSTKKLVYFEKQDSIWGEPLDLTHVQEYNPLIQINLYRNPAFDYVDVQLHPKNLPATFQLFNINGQQIISQKIEQVSQSIQFNGKPVEVFIIKVINKDGYYNFKKLIVR